MTDRTITVALSTKQFSVADYTYDYRFSDPKNDWLKLKYHRGIAKGRRNSQYLLRCFRANRYCARWPLLHPVRQRRSVYQWAEKHCPGTTLLYLNGKWQTGQTGHLQHSSIQHIAFGKEISYSVEPVNTGNVYYFIYVTGELHGLFVKSDSTPAGHLLMPQCRPACQRHHLFAILPGIYKATYGYKTDAGTTVMKSGYILFIPPWFIAVLLVIIYSALNSAPTGRKARANQG